MTYITHQAEFIPEFKKLVIISVMTFVLIVIVIIVEVRLWGVSSWPKAEVNELCTSPSMHVQFNCVSDYEKVWSK